VRVCDIVVDELVVMGPETKAWLVEKGTAMGVLEETFEEATTTVEVMVVVGSRT